MQAVVAKQGVGSKLEAPLTRLRPYQEAAIEKIRAAFASGKRRVILQLPTGGGKTLCAASIIQGAVNTGHRVLFICERITLVIQSASVFSGCGFRVGVIQASHPDRDDGAPVQVASIQTLVRRAEQFQDWGMVFIDECHCQSKQFPVLMDRLPNTPFIGLSATPWARGMGKLWDGLVVGARVPELIAGGYLVDTEVYGPAQPDMTGVRVTMTRYGRDYEEGETAKRAMKIVGDAVENWLRYGGDRQTAMFATNIAHSRALTEAFQKAGVAAEHVDAYTDSEERAETFRRFDTGDTRIISSVDVISRGWDKPAVSCLILARPTKSLILHIQQIGRALRPYPGKNMATVIDMAGNTARHGFITDPLPEELDDGTQRVNEKKERSIPLPKPCPSCHFMKPAGVHACPKCGFAPQKQNTVVHEEGTLVRISKTAAREVTRQERDRFYAEMLGLCKERGWKPGMAYYKTRERYGDAPRTKPEPMPPSQETRNFVKAEQRKYFSQKRKEGQNGKQYVGTNDRGRIFTA